MQRPGLSLIVRFLILSTDYPDFLRWLYGQHPGLESASYERQMHARVESLFGTADFCSSNLRRLGHEAWDIHANNEFMQKAWAREHGIGVEERSEMSRLLAQTSSAARRLAAGTGLTHIKRLFRAMLPSSDNQGSWYYDVLKAQVRHYKPDVLLNHDLRGISADFLQEIKPYVRLLVGQHSATRLCRREDWSCYDLVISSFPPTVDFFRERGVSAELHRLCFEPSVLSCLRDEEKNFDVTFVGSLHSVHSSRVTFLNAICARFPQARIWGPGIHHLHCSSCLSRCYMGQSWGREMFQVLRRSKMVLNHHGDIPHYANNMRLFEATGVGTLLITDWKINLHEIFEPAKEVLTYRSAEECIELIDHYLDDGKGEVIARAGQQRTLRDHTYYNRMQELLHIVVNYL